MTSRNATLADARLAEYTKHAPRRCECDGATEKVLRKGSKPLDEALDATIARTLKRLLQA